VENLWMVRANPVDNPPSHFYFQKVVSARGSHRRVDVPFALRFA
jgi:hypothetical protein